MWQQYFERAPRQHKMSTLSAGIPQGSACYWDLTAQLSNSGVCFLWDNWKVLIPPISEENTRLWRNGTRLNRAFSTSVLQKGGKVFICCRKWLLFPWDTGSTLILLFLFDSFYIGYNLVCRKSGASHRFYFCAFITVQQFKSSAPWRVPFSWSCLDQTLGALSERKNTTKI